jgi:hypothetical protein
MQLRCPGRFKNLLTAVNRLLDQTETTLPNKANAYRLAFFAFSDALNLARPDAVCLLP